MVLRPVVSSLPSLCSMSQQHLTEAIMGLFFKPLLTQLPAHTTSLVFTGCSWLDLLNVLEL